MEANKKGLNLPTVRNRCFYHCLAKSLDFAEDYVVEMVESCLTHLPPMPRMFCSCSLTASRIVYAQVWYYVLKEK